MPVNSTVRVLGSHGHAVADDDRPQVRRYTTDGGLQVHPVCVRHKLPNDLLLRLGQDRVIAGVKDSSGDDVAFRQLLVELHDAGLEDFAAFTGHEVMVDSMLLAGASGSVPGLANVDPDGYVRLHRATGTGDVAWPGPSRNDWGRQRQRALSCSVAAAVVCQAVRWMPGIALYTSKEAAVKTASSWRDTLSTARMSACMRSESRWHRT